MFKVFQNSRPWLETSLLISEALFYGNGFIFRLDFHRPAPSGGGSGVGTRSRVAGGILSVFPGEGFLNR